MAAVTFTKRQSYLEGYQYSEVISDGNTGGDIIVSPVIAGKRLTCRLICGAGSGKIQTTTSADSAVAAGTANWVDHPSGPFTGTFTDAIVGEVTGVRGVSVSGEITIEVVI